MIDTGCDHGEVFDAVVIGTGFAGAVTAARLVQAGQRICVLERGRRFEANDFPMYPNSESLLAADGGLAEQGAAPDLSRWLWRADQGLYDVRDLDDVISVQAAGYGGGSLIYANVHLRAPQEVFDQGWPYTRETLDPYYDRAAYMLDVKPMPKEPPWRLRKTEQLMRAAAPVEPEGLNGVVQAIDPPLAVHFGEERAQRGYVHPFPGFERGPSEPRQQACDRRGQCWLGCRRQAKNSLDLNYLAIAEDGVDDEGYALADIRTLAEVCHIERIKFSADGGTEDCGCGARFVVHYDDRLIATTNADRNGADGKRSVAARYVFLCAGSVNTTELLLKSQKDLGLDGDNKLLPLGSRYYPNADSIAAVFECEQPQHADVGPTITKALLYHRSREIEDAGEGRDRTIRVIDFQPIPPPPDEEGAAVSNLEKLLAALKPGAEIFCNEARVTLVQAPLFDFGSFESENGAAMLVIEGNAERCRKGAVLAVDPLGPFGRALGEAQELDDWFLIEDGGYPNDLEPLLGILRSPLWMRRNRHIDRQNEHTFAPPSPPQMPEPSGIARFPLATAMESFLGVPRQPTKVSTNVPGDAQDDDQQETGGGISGGSPEGEQSGGSLAAEGGSSKATSLINLPPEIQRAFAENRADLAQLLAPLIQPMLDTVLDDVAKRLVARFDVDDVTRIFGDAVTGEIGEVPDDKKEILLRGLMRQGIQLLWGSEVALAARINELLVDKFPKDLPSLANLLAPVVGWLLQYREGDGHTALLLTMGRDQYRGRFDFDEQRLSVTLPTPLAPSSRVAQEQVLRDIAKLWKGELRTNPAWTSLKRRVTVHSQGGCPMGPEADEKEEESNAEGKPEKNNPDISVTAPSGEVRGCEGLYVMDAAAFPTAVGVNPSATIAAVAEYKIERFIKGPLAFGYNDSVIDAEKCKIMTGRSQAYDEKMTTLNDDVAAWATRVGKDVLDPIGALGHYRSGAPSVEPFGVEFEETLSGLFCESVDDISDHKDERTSVETWADLSAIAERRKDFEQAERRGIADRCQISMSLKAIIKDLDRFLTKQRHGLVDNIRLKEGTISIQEWTGDGEGGGGQSSDVVPEKSYLQFFVDPNPSNRNGVRQRFFRYHIETEAHIIEAAKVVRDDTRFDVWQDLSTLYVDVFEAGPERRHLHRGIMRLAPLDFFDKQMASIKITPDSADPSRRSWAYAAFVRYFGDELARIYLRNPGIIKEAFANILDPLSGV